MKKRTARDRAYKRYVRREATRRPDSAVPPAVWGWHFNRLLRQAARDLAA